MADGTSFSGITGPALAPALDEPGIQRLAQQAAAIALAGQRVLRRGFVRIGREHVEQVRGEVESAAAQIVRDYLDQTPRGVRRAARQRRAGADPAGVLDPARLEAVVANAMRDARPRKRPSRSKAAAVAPPGAKTAEECGLKPLPKRDQGDPGLVDSRRPNDAAAEIEVVGGGCGADPVLWLMAIEAQAEAEAEWRAAAPPAPRMRPRRPRPILHLKRRAS